MPRDSNGAIRISPLVIGELEAHVPFSGCDVSCGASSRAVRPPPPLPVARSIASTRYLCTDGDAPRGPCDASIVTPAGTAVSTYTRSFHTNGDADPRPGISIFHLMFFVSSHCSGGVAVFETPVAYGPRHCGQNFSASVAAD